MERRSILAMAGCALSTLFTGCTDAFGSEDGRPDDAGGGNDGNRDRGLDTEDGVHHLYLVNLDDTSRRVHLEVVHQESDQPAIEGTYDIPHERGGEFREVAVWNNTYEVTATLTSGVSETFIWTIESCPGPEAEAEAAELPDGSRNGSVRIEPGADDLSFVTDSCDELVAGTEVPTGGAQRFRVEETD